MFTRLAMELPFAGKAGGASASPVMLCPLASSKTTVLILCIPMTLRIHHNEPEWSCASWVLLRFLCSSHLRSKRQRKLKLRLKRKLQLKLERKLRLRLRPKLKLKLRLRLKRQLSLKLERKRKLRHLVRIGFGGGLIATATGELDVYCRVAGHRDLKIVRHGVGRDAYTSGLPAVTLWDRASWGFTEPSPLSHVCLRRCISRSSAVGSQSQRNVQDRLVRDRLGSNYKPLGRSKADSGDGGAVILDGACTSVRTFR